MTKTKAARMKMHKSLRRACRALFEYIKRAIVFVLVFTITYSALYGCKDIIRDTIRILFKTEGNDIPGVTLKAYSVMALVAAALFSVIACLCLYWHTKRDYQYLANSMKTDDERTPAADMDDLVRKISGESSKDVRSLIEQILKKQVETVANLLSKPLSRCKTIIITGDWGVGKTTTLLLGIEKISEDTNKRYIYESAFTYANDLSGMENGILGELNDTMEERGLFLGREAKTIAESINGNKASDLLLILGVKQRGSIASASIKKLNEMYDDVGNKKKFEIDVIIDDIDRLPAKDIIEAISFASLLNRLKFVRLILPLDIEAINKQLNGIIYESETYLNKYLPSQNTVEIKSNYGIAAQIAEQKMHGHGKCTKNMAFSPIWSAILYKIIDKKVKKEAKNWARDFRWTNMYAIPRAENNNAIVTALKKQTESLRSIYAPAPYYLENISDGRNFTTFITQPTMNDENGTKVKDIFSKEYYGLFAEWVPVFASKYWRQLGITMRDVTDVLSELDDLDLAGIEKDTELFAKAFNHLYKQNVITIKE